MSEVTITITNWEKYNPKRDQKHYTWLRLDNDIANDVRLFGLTAEQKFIWVHLLCLASKAGAGTALVNLTQIERVLEVDTKTVSDTVSFLSNKGIIGVVYTTGSEQDTIVYPEVAGRVGDTTRSCTSSDTTPTNERTYGRTNVTDDTDETHMSTSVDLCGSFFALWNEHCRELPKAQKLTNKRRTAIRARLDDEPDLSIWRQAIERMAASDFCNGKGPTGWVATFDFLLQPDSLTKVQEGKYDNRAGALGIKTKQDQISANNLSLLAELQAEIGAAE